MKTHNIGVGSNGVQHKLHVDGDRITIEEYTPTYVQNAIVDSAKRIRETQHGKSPLVHAARVPTSDYFRWKREWSRGPNQDMTFDAFVIMKVNSGDYDDLRTGTKRNGKPMRL